MRVALLRLNPPPVNRGPSARAGLLQKFQEYFFLFTIDQDLRCDFTIFNFKISNFS